ncbi:hypothetical protein Bca4012_088194 [Brassica carinata]|uniref:DUF3741 domain-containing protein n=3 Tax=Brassica TaxID=3705 RepID=A0ABQ7BRC5_BRACR|nr:hypothetical protein F2Q68_00030206 [Brassica cretica]KAF3534847.1 hypothetical protein DY000_02038442 [Brassica cretica]CAF2071952.1 unnamed protein product [Brassica napus]
MVEFLQKHGGRRSSQMSLEAKHQPRTVAGESVLWCETGVVAKLMGLEMLPVQVKGKPGKDKLGTLLKRERLRRRYRTLGVNRRNIQTTEASCASGDFNAIRPIRAGPTFRFP